ncbi:hypothetical protein [Streptomyces adelaidensis]|uniref:hypothetical protein n=1 Tax=Streptomyces adelaidensis TaxID=2796465 RepID=UPI001905613B|nr:hypothetical protein [Streptomyces adelaidensis]
MAGPRLDVGRLAGQSGAGSVLAVENSQTAPLPVSGYQNHPSTSPPVTRAVGELPLVRRTPRRLDGRDAR